MCLLVSIKTHVGSGNEIVAYNVDRKHLIRFESENAVLKFCSVDKALNFALLQNTLVLKE